MRNNEGERPKLTRLHQSDMMNDQIMVLILLMKALKSKFQNNWKLFRCCKLENEKRFDFGK